MFFLHHQQTADMACFHPLHKCLQTDFQTSTKHLPMLLPRIILDNKTNTESSHKISAFTIEIKRFQINYILRRGKKTYFQKNILTLSFLVLQVPAPRRHTEMTLCPTHTGHQVLLQDKQLHSGVLLLFDVNTRMSLRRRLLKPPNTYMVLKRKKEIQ